MVTRQIILVTRVIAFVLTWYYNFFFKKACSSLISAIYPSIDSVFQSIEGYITGLYINIFNQKYVFVNNIMYVDYKNAIQSIGSCISPKNISIYKKYIGNISIYQFFFLFFLLFWRFGSNKLPIIPFFCC